MKPQRSVRPQHQARNAQRRDSRDATNNPINHFKVVYVVVSALVICSMLAVALATIDFGGIFSDDNAANIENPNADIIAEQETAVAENPNDVEEIALLADLLANTGQMPQAIPWYEKALELAPDDNGVRVSFAMSLADAGYQPDAEAQFLRVLDDDPDNQTAHYYIAELYMNWSPPQQGKAIEHYQRAMELDPGSFIGERAEIRLNSMKSSSPIATPEASPGIQGP